MTQLLHAFSWDSPAHCNRSLPSTERQTASGLLTWIALEMRDTWIIVGLNLGQLATVSDLNLLESCANRIVS